MLKYILQYIFFSDFHLLETDVKKEISLRSKVGANSAESVLISGLNLSPALEFERSDATRRLRLVLSELLVIMGNINKDETTNTNSSNTTINIKSSELFDHIVYLSEVCDVLGTVSYKFSININNFLSQAITQKLNFLYYVLVFCLFCKQNFFKKIYLRLRKM